MINNYQEEQALKQPEPEAARLATVYDWWGDGLQLIFDGETESDGKHYKCNANHWFQAGDRVLVQKVGGSYVVICKIGGPSRDLYGYYKGPVSYEMKDADGTLASATSRINRIIDILQSFGICY